MSKQLPLLAGSLTALSLCGTAFAQTFQLDPLWSKAPGTEAFLGTANNERSLAYNPVNDHVYVVSRATTPLTVNILSGANGSSLGTLDITGITGGTFALSAIGVGSDGAIYAANLTTASSTSPFKIYRWANEAAQPTVAYSGNPATTSQRFGDNFAVRGSGNDTRIIAASGTPPTGSTANVLAVFSTANATAFTSKEVVVQTGTSFASGDMRLGLDFAAGNSVYGKQAGALRRISYDLETGVGTVEASYTLGSATATPGPLGVKGDKLVAYAYSATAGTAQRVNLYDLSTLSTSEVNNPSDTEILGTSNANSNGVGAVDFNADGTKVFVLAPNNGVAAYAITPVPEPHEYALVAGLGLLGFAAYRRWHLKQA